MSLGLNPTLQLVRAIRSRDGWAWSKGAARHRSGAVVEIRGVVFAVRGDPQEYIMPESAMRLAERAAQQEQMA